MALRRMYFFALVISSLAWLSVLCEVRLILSLPGKLPLFWTPSGRWSGETAMGFARRGEEEGTEGDKEEGGGEVGKRANLGSGDRLELEEEEHEEDEEERAAEDDDGWEVVLDARGLGGCCFAGAGFLKALCEGPEDGGESAEEGDEAGRGDSACSHGTDVGAPEIGGGHLGDEDGAGVERGGEVRGEEGDGRHEDE